MLLPAHVLTHFGQRHGIATRSELLALGLSSDQIRYLLRTGRLERVHRGVYRLASSPRTFEAAAVAACGFASDIRISHLAAGRLWGYRKCVTDTIDVLIPGDAHRSLVGVRQHISHRIDPCDWLLREDGIRLTTPTRTIFDLAWTLSDGALESVVEHALQLGMTDIDALERIGERLRERGRNGSARFARVLEARNPKQAPVESDLELRVERALRAAGVARPIRQHVFSFGDLQFRVDFYWPDASLVL
ncbi:MAG: hypothetical protein JWL70_2389, partial [Acidimicrobiia bacterium]|nr:hypothetical protein [Acidimicrobiia bacterium]